MHVRSLTATARIAINVHTQAPSINRLHVLTCDAALLLQVPVVDYHDAAVFLEPKKA